MPALRRDRQIGRVVLDDVIEARHLHDGVQPLGGVAYLHPRAPSARRHGQPALRGDGHGSRELMDIRGTDDQAWSEAVDRIAVDVQRDVFRTYCVYERLLNVTGRDGGHLEPICRLRCRPSRWPPPDGRPSMRRLWETPCPG